MGSISYVKVKRKKIVKLNIPCHVSSLATFLLLWSILKRSDFLKHLAIKNCEKTILKNI